MRPSLVPKPGAKFRFTVDLRPVNWYTVQHHFPMPNLEHSEASGFEFLCDFRPVARPLELGSQAMQSFITPDWIYSRYACYMALQMRSHICNLRLQRLHHQN